MSAYANIAHVTPEERDALLAPLTDLLPVGEATELPYAPAGPMDGVDIDAVHYRRRMPRGLDQQGRYPDAAPDGGDPGADDDALATADGILRALMWLVGLYAVGALVFSVLT